MHNEVNGSKQKKAPFSVFVTCGKRGVFVKFQQSALKLQSGNLDGNSPDK